MMGVVEQLRTSSVQSIGTGDFPKGPKLAAHGNFTKNLRAVDPVVKDSIKPYYWVLVNGDGLWVQIT